MSSYTTTDFERGMDVGRQFEAAQLNDENARLRELVEDMLDCIEIRAAFGRPPTSEMYEEFARRADELGIEVDR
jgi:hypothetical protein